AAASRRVLGRNSAHRETRLGRGILRANRAVGIVSSLIASSSGRTTTAPPGDEFKSNRALDRHIPQPVATKSLVVHEKGSFAESARAIRVEVDSFPSDRTP